MLIYNIGKMIMDYEKTICIDEYKEEKLTKLLKTKEVTKLYPALTLYALNKAVSEERLPVIKIGNLNYFTKDDIEKFLKHQSIKKENRI